VSTGAVVIPCGSVSNVCVKVCAWHS
jgi:hypothetical protein